MMKIWKQFTLMMFFIIMIFAINIKVDASAATDIVSDVIWNTTGEKDPWGDDFVAKYWDGSSYGYKYPCTTFASWNSKHQLTNITYEVEYRYDLIDDMTELVNKERAKAGVSPLAVTDDMTRIAMQRAAETALYWSHTRPNGMGYSTLSCLEDSENIHACSYAGEPASEANESLVNSSGHYKNMVNSKWKYAGYGVVNVRGCTYWVQVFADGKGDYYPERYPDMPYDWKNASYTKKNKYKKKVTVPICADYLNLTVGAEEGWTDAELAAGMTVGEGTTRYGLRTSIKTTQSWVAEVPLSSDQYTMESLNDCLEVKDGVITAVKAGTGQVKFTLKANKNKYTIADIKVKNGAIKTGSKVMVSGNTYKVTSTKSKTASFFSGKKDAKTVSIPKTVKIQGKTYKVTSIDAGAFENNTKITSVTIGSNITKIGSKAFYGCRNLKKITVKSTKLTSVGKNALKGIHKKAVIKVPKSKLSKYKKLFKGKGQQKTVKIQK